MFLENHPATNHTQTVTGYMTKRNLSIAALLIFLITCCSKKKELNGYWYGEFKFDKERSPALLKFENNTFIDFFSPFNDTTIYKSYGNKIYFDNSFNEKRELKIKLKNNELSTWESNSDSLIVILKKRVSSNLIFDYLNDKNLVLNLPEGKGEERIFGQSVYLKRPLYLAYKDNKLTANFLDSSVTVNSDYHKFLFSKLDSMHEYDKYSSINRISLIADRDLKISDIDLLTTQLRIFGFSKIRYFLKSESYEKVNTFDFRLKVLTDDEYEIYNIKENSLRIPPPPSHLEYIAKSKDKLRLIEVDRQKIKLNDSIVTENDLLKLLMPQMTSDSDLNFAYYMTDGSTYQDFIHFNDIILNAIYDVRNDYLMNKHNTKYSKVGGFGSKKNREVETKHPLRLIHLNLKEYKKLKYNL